MKYDDFPKQTLLASPIALPSFYKGGDTAVLLIHGYTGIPHEFIYVAERLNKEGYTVYIPRLPGHGTSPEDFLQTNRNDWIRKVVDTYMDLKISHKEVYVAGLSMGGLLTILLAAKYDIPKIVLAAPALRTKNRKIYYTPFIKLFSRQIMRDENYTNPDKEMYKIGKVYWNRDYPPMAAELLKLQKMAEKELPNVKSSALTIVSKSDGTVPLEVKDIIEEKIGSDVKKTIILEKSGHVLINDVDREKVADDIIEWFKK
ncbi:MAG TPA: alpha/beta fold hydrolase [Petrotogaceae bacterium]|nr:alpha/beta fold hydrolase [Petrotogaceae bacterium]